MYNQIRVSSVLLTVKGFAPHEEFRSRKHEDTKTVTKTLSFSYFRVFVIQSKTLDWVAGLSPRWVRSVAKNAWASPNDRQQFFGGNFSEGGIVDVML